MWKDFFFFSKGERNGILVLICLIVVVFGINGVLPLFLKKEQTDISAYQADIEKFSASLEQKNMTSTYTETKRELFHFNPNTLDLDGFVRLGIPTYLAERIIKYRSKGGAFRKPENFAKIYGMPEALYLELLPYIRIEDQKKKEKYVNFPSKDNATGKITERASPEFSKNFPKRSASINIIELNSSDTAALKSLKGIGNVYAERIIKYRDYLGGFYCVEQLKEVYGISEELFSSIKAYLSVDQSHIRKIRLNHGDLQVGLRHPYLKKEQLNVLITFKKRTPTVNSLDKLKELSLFSDEEWERLTPYLSLE